MSAPHDNFDRLLKLLVVKRHETPPPGFFDRLPDRIRARIEADQEAPGWLAAWRRWLNFEWGFKPALAGAMLAAAAGLYLAEVVQNPGGSRETGPQPSPNYGLAIVPAVVSNSSPRLLADQPATPWAAPAPTSLHPHLGTAPPPELFRPGAALPTSPSPATFIPAGVSLPGHLPSERASNTLHSVDPAEWTP